MTATAKLTREEFVGWIGASHVITLHHVGQQELLQDVKGKDILLWWPMMEAFERDEAPIIVINDNAIGDFVAFASTYIGNYTPFTAFFSVVPSSVVPLLTSRDTRKHSSSLPDELVGVIIAEAALQIGDTVHDIGNISLQACRATVSSSVLQALRSGYDADPVSAVVANWGRARSLLLTETLRFPVRHVEKFWLTLAPIVSNALTKSKSKGTEGVIGTFLSQFLDRLEVSDDAWYSLVCSYSEFHDALKKMEGSREDRVRHFDRMTRALFASGDIDQQLREIIAGVLMSRVAQGSFQYMSFGRSIERQLPAAKLWFALISSVHARSDVYSSGGSLGRRLSRQLGRHDSLHGHPDADVGIDELQVLVGEQMSDVRFRTEFWTFLTVELLPGVSARFRSQPHESDDAKNLPRLAVNVLRQIQYLLRNADQLMDGLVDRKGS